jgi:hypothetical protein
MLEWSSPTPPSESTQSRISHLLLHPIRILTPLNQTQSNPFSISLSLPLSLHLYSRSFVPPGLERLTKHTHLHTTHTQIAHCSYDGQTSLTPPPPSSLSYFASRRCGSRYRGREGELSSGKVLLSFSDFLLPFRSSLHCRDSSSRSCSSTSPCVQVQFERCPFEPLSPFMVRTGTLCPCLVPSVPSTVH